MRICSLATYRELLELALHEEWTFCRYTADLSSVPRALLLRHDVDYSLDLAVEMARVNASLGVRGTFFLLVRSNVYNLLAPRNLHQARTLLDLGQWIGLHFAALDPVPECAEQVVSLVQREMDLYRRELPQTEPVVAWHNPAQVWLDRYAELEIPDLVNVYRAPFTKAIVYRSDSNLRHTAADFEKLLRDGNLRQLHLLFHPLNWVVGGGDMVEILAGTWRQVIAEREEEFRLNRVYQDALPHGMPTSILEQFSRDWLVAARRAG